MVSKRYDEEDNENKYNSLNIFIRLASDLLRKLCSNDSVRVQVTAFDGIPVCLRYIHTVPICMYVRVLPAWPGHLCHRINLHSTVFRGVCVKCR